MSLILIHTSVTQVHVPRSLHKYIYSIIKNENAIILQEIRFPTRWDPCCNSNWRECMSDNCSSEKLLKLSSSELSSALESDTLLSQQKLLATYLTRISGPCFTRPSILPRIKIPVPELGTRCQYRNRQPESGTEIWYRSLVPKSGTRICTRMLEP